MIFTGLPEVGWEAYWYASVDEIADPDKALARWLKGARRPERAGGYQRGVRVRRPGPSGRTARPRRAPNGA